MCKLATGIKYTTSAGITELHVMRAFFNISIEKPTIYCQKIKDKLDHFLNSNCWPQHIFVRLQLFCEDSSDLLMTLASMYYAAPRIISTEKCVISMGENEVMLSGY